MHGPLSRSRRLLPLLLFPPLLLVAPGCKGGAPERPILYPFDFGAGPLVDRQPPVQFGRSAAPASPSGEPRTLGEAARLGGDTAP